MILSGNRNSIKTTIGIKQHLKNLRARVTATNKRFHEFKKFFSLLHQVRTAEDFMRVFATPTYKHFLDTSNFEDLQKKKTI